MSPQDGERRSRGVGGPLAHRLTVGMGGSMRFRTGYLSGHRPGCRLALWVATCLALSCALAGCAADFMDGSKTQAGSSRPAAGQAASKPAAPPASPLTATSWRLVRFQSSDDTLGAMIPPQVDRYTLTFSAEGLLSLGLDCNRGTARWEATPSVDGAPGGGPSTGSASPGSASPGSASGGNGRQSGGLTITPGPMTRAWCGERAIDSRLMRDLVDVRSFTIENGRLRLWLKADGGYYLWDRM